MDDILDPTPGPPSDPAPAASRTPASGDGAHTDQTLDMSQVAGDRDVPVAPPEKKDKKKKKKERR